MHILSLNTKTVEINIAYVVVQFYPWFKFYFPSFLGMVMLIMSLKQRKIKFKPRIKLNHNTYITLMMMFAISDNKQKNLQRSCSKQSENAQKT